MIEAALDLAKQGFSVLPCFATAAGKCTCGNADCDSPGKHPRTAHGCKDASNDPVVVAEMFGRFRDSNVAIATGVPSNVWVLDVEATGLPDLSALEKAHSKLPATLQANTGRGGVHFYFRWKDEEIRNRQRIAGLSIDVRGLNGYAVCPPSQHVSGRSYSWNDPPETTPIADAPPWLLDLVTGREKHSDMVIEIRGTLNDLASAPGVEKGARHDMATKLIGSAIGSGLDRLEVLRQALDWGRRCTPPMPDTEILRIVTDLFNREDAKSSILYHESELTPLPAQVPWPTLDPAALYGTAGEIVNVIEPETEADPVAILIQLLVSFGNLVGRSPYFMVEGTRHHANMFTVLVGKTARGRKGTSEGRSRQILAFADGEWATNDIKSGLSSGEGLIWNVRDPVYKIEQIKEKGKVVGTQEVLADPGIDDKRLLVVEPEFASVLRVCRRETNTLSPTLRSAWDSGNLRTLAKNLPAKATNAHVSIVGHITAEELHRALSEAESFNGFANRFLWPVVTRSKLLPEGGQELDLGTFARQIAEAVPTSREIGRMHRSKAAAALWRKVYPDLSNDGPGGVFGAVTSRAEAQVLRLSMIYALLAGSATIDEPHLRAALAVWTYCRDSARLIFGNTSADPLAERLFEIICKQPGLGRREIHRATSNNMKGAVLIEKLVLLRDAGRVRVKTISTGGRNAEQWFPISQPLTGLSSLSSLSSSPAQPESPPAAAPPDGIASLDSSTQSASTAPSMIEEEL
jgi:hypothetical protein